MNIYAIEGHKVMATGKNGYTSDKERIAELLEVGVEYTVDHTMVGQSSTSVYLKEVPNQSFNSVCFVDAVEQSEEDDKLHEDWAMWNR